MPMDGLTLGFAARELNTMLVGGRIDRITQPEKDTVILLCRVGGVNRRLLLCASAQNARCHLTERGFPNPLEPPMFCMLLRKQLMGGHILAVRQLRGDRIVHVDIDAVDEMGDHVLRRLVLEVMGRHSNLILVDHNGRILDSAHHVSEDMSRVRQLMPGIPYEDPPTQDKLCSEDCTAEALRTRLTAQGDTPLWKALGNSVNGLSSVSAQELAFRVLPPGADRTEDWADCTVRLAAFIAKLPDLAAPCVELDADGDPCEVFPFPYLSRGIDRQRPRQTLSDAIESCFGSRDAKDRIRQKSASMLRLLKGQVERCEKKLALQEEELAGAAHMEDYRIMGELLHANLYQLHKGQASCTLPNYYDENGGEMTIPLDVTLSPAQNASRYFKKYQKARSAQQTAAEQREKTLKELDYLEGMLLDVGKCVGESELEEIREELARTGYMKRVTSRKEKRTLPPSKPYRYLSSDGIEIHVGKNAAQNERLTGTAPGDQTWLHAKDMPGSHVLIRSEEAVPEATLREAAQLAAWYSKGQRSSNVPVDYTLRRYVKKPGGTAPGYVIYTHQHTVYMTVEEADIKRLKLLEE